MPIYEYKCKDCHHCFERLVLNGEQTADLKCPQCGDGRVEKLMSCANSLGGEKSPFCSTGSSGFS